MNGCVHKSMNDGWTAALDKQMINELLYQKFRIIKKQNNDIKYYI